MATENLGDYANENTVNDVDDIIYKSKTEETTLCRNRSSNRFKDNPFLLNEDKYKFMTIQHKQNQTEEENIKTGNTVVLKR